MLYKPLIPVRFAFVLAALSVFLLNTATAQNFTEGQLFREMDRLYTELEAGALVQQGKLASTPALALVPLTFDRDGSLLTAKEFNALIANNAWDAKRYKNFWTDFTTYQIVLRKAEKLGLQTRARVDLVKDHRYVVPPYDARYKALTFLTPFKSFTERGMKQKKRWNEKRGVRYLDAIFLRTFWEVSICAEPDTAGHVALFTLTAMLYHAAMNLPLQLGDLRTELGRVKLEAAQLTAGLNGAQPWQKPADGGWSVGECLVHLNLAGEPYAQKMRTALVEARGKERRGTGPFRFGFLGGQFVRSLSAESKGKFKAPAVWQPEPQADVLERFTRLQDDLLELTREADGLDLARIKLASPVSPLVRLNLFEALNLIAVHEDRHLKQARRVRQSLNVSGANVNMS